MRLFGKLNFGVFTQASQSAPLPGVEFLTSLVLSSGSTSGGLEPGVVRHLEMNSDP